MASAWRWLGAMGTTICGETSLQVAQGKFQSAIFRVVILSYAEDNIDEIAGQKRRLLQPFGHVPAESIEGDLGSEVGS